jgi:glucokinase
VPSVVAVDVGGTSIKAGRVDDTGALLARETVATPVADGATAVVAAIAGAVRNLLAEDVVAVGIVSPGVVDAARGVVAYATNLGFRDVALTGALQAELGVPVVLDKDVRATGLAERTLGSARDVADCLVVALGTGISALAVVGGVSIDGRTGLAGEIGHISVDPAGDPCPCGQRGCAERYASGAGIARRYRERTGVSRSAAELVGRLAADADAHAVWTEAAEALGAVLAATTLVLDPARIVLSGGLAAAGPALHAPVAGALAARLSWRPAPELVVSPLAGDAGLLGAALLAWRAIGTAPPSSPAVR